MLSAKGLPDAVWVELPEMPLFDVQNLAQIDAQGWGLLSAVAGAWIETPIAAQTSQWVVGLQDGFGAGSLGVLAPQQVTAAPFLQNAYIVQFANFSPIGVFAPQFETVTGLDYFFPLVDREILPMAVPNDPLFFDQWHLLNFGQTGGTVGVDANVVGVWDSFLGNGVVVAIVDTGLNHAHPDLVNNYIPGLSFDFVSNDSDPSPTSATESHGTAVAGVVGAEGDNFIGVSGAAPEVGLAGIRFLGGPGNDLYISNNLSFQQGQIDIYNNSWGFGPGSLAPAGPLSRAALQDGVTSGRGALGNIFVFAAGNGLQSNDNVNYHGFQNSRYVVSVAAIDDDGNQAVYSTPGAAVFISGHSAAFGGDPVTGISTTDQQGANGYNSVADASDGDPEPDLDYTSTFSGTSSAAPLVSGVIALILDANPNLTYRDVQHILARTASLNDSTDSDWYTNAAGFHVNHKYGFGAIDAAAAVALALTWTTVPVETNIQTPQFVNQTLPDNNATGRTSTIAINTDLTVEWVEVTFTATHTYRGDLEVVLVSPSGTRSILAEQRFEDGGNNYNNWTFSTNRNWGETSLGNWTLEVRDLAATDTGTWNFWVLNVFGSAPLPNSGTVDLIIDADDPGGNGVDNGQADEFRLVKNGAFMQVYIDGNFSQQLLYSTVRSVTVNGSGDNDTLLVDNGNGFLGFDVNFNGGLGADDSLRINGGATAAATGLYQTGLPDATGHSGVVKYQFGASELVIAFNGLEPIEDLMVAASFTIEDTTAANVINVTDGPQSVGLDPKTGAVAGTYQVNFGGAAEQYFFRNKKTLVINGLGGADAFHMNLAGPATADGMTQVTFIAGAGDSFNFTSPGFNRGEPLNVLFDGVAGTHATLFGSSQSEYALLRPGFARLDGGGYRVTVRGPNDTVIHSGGGANERVDFIDSPGNDVFSVNPAQGRLTGAGFDLRGIGFDQYWAYATSGGALDRADIFDSTGNDYFVSFPTKATVTGPGYFAYAGFFDRFFAYGLNGGTDQADVHGSNGNDQMFGYLTHIKLQGASVFTEASGFEFLFGHAEGGTGDRADLYDTSANDTFYSDATQAYLYNSTYFNAARGFDQVFAHSTSGGNDVADLFDSAGNDTFYADPFKAYLYNSSFLVFAAGFDAVVGHATAGNDRADLFDSSGNDVFDGFPTDARMSGAGYANSAAGFDRVFGHAINGGSDDHAILRQSAVLDEFFGRANFGQFTNFGQFFYYLQGFDRITLFSDITGPDRVDVQAVDYIFTRVGSTGLV